MIPKWAGVVSVADQVVPSALYSRRPAPSRMRALPLRASAAAAMMP